MGSLMLARFRFSAIDMGRLLWRSLPGLERSTDTHDQRGIGGRRNN
jgi:hypothetical protein